MICNQCGTEYDTGGFCPNCGAENSLEKETVQTETYTEPEAVATAELSEVPVMSKKKTLPIVLSVVGVLLVAAVVLGYAFFPKISRLTMGEVKYYSAQESDNIERVFTSYVNATTAKKKAHSADGKMTFTVSGEGTDELKAMLENLSLIINTAVDESKGSLKLSLTDTDKTVEILNFLSDNGNAAATFFGDATQYNVFENDDKSTSGDATELIFGVSADELEELVLSYVDTVSGAFPKENVSTGSAKLDGTEYDTVTFVFDAKSIDAVAKALSEKLKNDKQLEKIIDNFIALQNKSSNQGDEMEKQTAAEIIKEICDELDSLKASIGTEDKAQYTVYYTSRGSIAARELKASDRTIAISGTEKDGTVTDKITFSGDSAEQNFEAKVEYKTVDDKTKGEGSVTAAGKMLATFDFDYAKKETCSLSLPVGAFNISVNSVNDMSGEGASVLGTVFNAKISIKTGLDSAKYTLDTTVSIGDTASVGANAVFNFSDKADTSAIKVDKSALKEFDEDAQTAIGELAGQKLMELPTVSSIFMTMLTGDGAVEEQADAQYYQDADGECYFYGSDGSLYSASTGEVVTETPETLEPLMWVS